MDDAAGLTAHGLWMLLPSVSPPAYDGSPGTEFLLRVRDAYLSDQQLLAGERDVEHAADRTVMLAEQAVQATGDLHAVAAELGLLGNRFLNSSGFEWPPYDFRDADHLMRYLCLEAAQHLIMALLERDD